ncbi:MAG: hypothetical protein JST39_23135, partial [Bacteroidetes bacterium]|nr:hypothetical protein [Bacteroidota bacterium]
MKRLLILLLLPIHLLSQEVQPVLSPDYKALINRNAGKTAGGETDSAHSLRVSQLRSPGRYSGGSISRIDIVNNYVTLRPLHRRTLFLSGSISTSLDLKNANRTPALQSLYVQGRPQGGQPVWRGPETGEMFSYGPAIGGLEYDGSSYAWDV